MEQKTIDNGNEFVIDTKTPLTEDSIYFRDNGDHISIAIENSGGEEATYIIYKKAAGDLNNWLTKHL
jgi:hypothetical protein